MSLAFGHKAKLDDLAKAFVGVGKPEDFGEAEKADMLETFRRDPARAYAYAITDAVLTLLVKEQMEATHTRMYRELGFDPGDIPPLPSTQGSRVAELIVRSVARAAGGSAVLSGRRGKQTPSGAVAKASPSKVKALLRKGSGGFLARGTPVPVRGADRADARRAVLLPVAHPVLPRRPGDAGRRRPVRVLRRGHGRHAAVRRPPA